MSLKLLVYFWKTMADLLRTWSALRIYAIQSDKNRGSVFSIFNSKDLSEKYVPFASMDFFVFFKYSREERNNVDFWNTFKLFFKFKAENALYPVSALHACVCKYGYICEWQQ